jgi:hypothetical protein
VKNAEMAKRSQRSAAEKKNPTLSIGKGGLAINKCKLPINRLELPRDLSAISL